MAWTLESSEWDGGIRLDCGRDHHHESNIEDGKAIGIEIDMANRACAAIIQRGSRVLVTQRKANQTFPLKWELPGGHVERNETRQACLRREIKEELGIDITALRPYCVRKYGAGKSSLVIYYYRCRIASGRPKKIEVRGFRWIEPAQHTVYDFISTDRSVLQKLSNPLTS